MKSFSSFVRESLYGDYLASTRKSWIKNLDTAKRDDHLPDHQMSEEELDNQRTHRNKFAYAHEPHNEYKDNSKKLFNEPLRDGYSKYTKKIHVPDTIADSDLRRNQYNFEDFKENVKGMDYNTSLKTKEPMTLYRGSTNKSFPVFHMEPGTEFTDHGYHSGSLEKGIAHGWGAVNPALGEGNYKTVAKINIPAGTQGHLLDLPDHESHINEEGEFVLHRGTTFRVTHHTVHTDAEGRNYHITHMDVIGQHAAPIYNDPDS